MSNFEKQQYDFLLKKRKEVLVKSKKDESKNISKIIKEIDEEMDYRDYNEEW